MGTAAVTRDWIPRIAILLLLLALLPMPYGYYTLLRVVVFGAAIFAALASREEGITDWVVVWSIVAALFNPVVPLSLGRAVWTFVDIATAGLFFLWLRHRRHL